jgi:hypothetical protein
VCKPPLGWSGCEIVGIGTADWSQRRRAGSIFLSMLGSLRGVMSVIFPRWVTEGSPTLDPNWLLRATFDPPNGVAAVFERLRSRERVLGSEVGGLLPSGTLLSRRHNTLSVYALTRSNIDLARMAIERVASAATLGADVRISQWDETVRAWRQVDPPLDGQEREMDEASAREAIRPDTRNLSYLVAWTARAHVEGPLRDFAQRRGLRCTVEEKRRLLGVRLTFSVTGPAYKLDEFAEYARSVVNSNDIGFTAAGPGG